MKPQEGMRVRITSDKQSIAIAVMRNGDPFRTDWGEKLTICAGSTGTLFRFTEKYWTRHAWAIHFDGFPAHSPDRHYCCMVCQDGQDLPDYVQALNQ